MTTNVPIPYLVLVGVGLLGLGASGVAFATLSAILDCIRALSHRLRRARPTFWHNPVLEEEKE